MSTAARNMITLAAVALVPLACASSGTPPPTAEDLDSIRRYSVGDPPRCEYEEVARMESESRGMPWRGDTEGLEYIERRKRERRIEIDAAMEQNQADAVYIVRRGVRVGFDSWILEEISFIRFRDRTCTA